MKTFVKYILVLFTTLLTFSCSQDKEEQEDRIITDLNEIFDPRHEGDTDWNYTEIDEDWLEDVGLYYDSNIGAYRQKQSIQKHKKESKPMNPITIYITLFGLCFLLFEIWLLYAAYQVAYSKHRKIGLWLFNCFLGGIWTFIVLSLSNELRYNEDLDIREESDLLGITIALGNITFLILIFLIIRLYIVMYTNPYILRDFLGV